MTLAASVIGRIRVDGQWAPVDKTLPMVHIPLVKYHQESGKLEHLAGNQAGVHVDHAQRQTSRGRIVLALVERAVLKKDSHAASERTQSKPFWDGPW